MTTTRVDIVRDDRGVVIGYLRQRNRGRIRGYIAFADVSRTSNRGECVARSELPSMCAVRLLGEHYRRRAGDMAVTLDENGRWVYPPMIARLRNDRHEWTSRIAGKPENFLGAASR